MSGFRYRFEWDQLKAATNSRRHGVSFEQAAGVFRDSEALTIHDRKHSGEEDRWITLGLDAEGRLLVVCHTWREDETGARCRIISARKASINESKHYRGKQT